MNDPLTHGGLHPLMVLAARARLNGDSWATVAKLVGRKVGTVEGWPGRHPRQWARAQMEALEYFAPALESEASLIARRNLRAGMGKTDAAGNPTEPSLEEKRLSQTAVRDIWRWRGDRRGRKIEVTGAEGGPLSILLGKTDEELDALIDRDRERKGEEEA